MNILPPHQLENPSQTVSFIVRHTNDVTVVPRHCHAYPQLLYTTSGLFQVNTDDRRWLVPNGQALWLPAGMAHEVKTYGVMAMHSLFFNPARETEFLDACCVVTISTLLRELIVHAARSQERLDAAATARLMSVILDQVMHLKTEPLFLPLARDSRLQPIMDRLLADPSDSRSLEEWAAEVGCCSRTLSRLFVIQTGLTFGRWRERARVLAALKGLSERQSVTELAYELGYRSQSAFIDMFKRTTGRTPGKFMRH